MGVLGKKAAGPHYNFYCKNLRTTTFPEICRQRMSFDIKTDIYRLFWYTQFSIVSSTAL